MKTLNESRSPRPFEYESGILNSPDLREQKWSCLYCMNTRNYFMDYGGLGCDAVYSCEMLVTTYKTTQRHNPERHNPHFHHHENLTSHGTTLAPTHCFAQELISDVILQFFIN
jgi:hypothetical protein